MGKLADYYKWECEQRIKERSKQRKSTKNKEYAMKNRTISVWRCDHCKYWSTAEQVQKVNVCPACGQDRLFSVQYKDDILQALMQSRALKNKLKYFRKVRTYLINKYVSIPITQDFAAVREGLIRLRFDMQSKIELLEELVGENK